LVVVPEVIPFLCSPIWAIIPNINVNIVERKNNIETATNMCTYPTDIWQASDRHLTDIWQISTSFFMIVLCSILYCKSIQYTSYTSSVRKSIAHNCPLELNGNWVAAFGVCRWRRRWHVAFGPGLEFNEGIWFHGDSKAFNFHHQTYPLVN
jgi:hypothetical protein